MAVHVTGINRLRIPGTFSVALQVDGATIAKQAVFQPQMPDKCPTCVKNAIANLVFDVDIAKISSGRVGVEISVVPIEMIGRDIEDNRHIAIEAERQVDLVARQLEHIDTAFG